MEKCYHHPKCKRKATYKVNYLFEEGWELANAYMFLCDEHHEKLLKMDGDARLRRYNMVQVWSITSLLEVK